MSDSRVDAIQTLYKSILSLIGGITIKYASKGEKYETLETAMDADQYIAAVQEMDTFLSYNDYTEEELRAVGIINEDIIKEVVEDGDTSNIPTQYKEPLLLLRRKRAVEEYVEKNNYYRSLYGYPDVECEDNVIYLFYTPEGVAHTYNIDPTIPVHLLQDYYDDLNGTGTYVVSILEGLGIIDDMKEEADERIASRVRSFQISEDDVDAEKAKYNYLNYLGSKRIDIVDARTAGNFQIIQLLPGKISYRIYSEFLRIYDACREYFVSTIYMPQFRTFIDYYDNFIALSIMIMAIQQIIMQQVPYGLRRSFFDIYSVKALYEMYDMPYNLRLDMDLQDHIVQNLNMLIQNKATDKVIFDIAAVLGLENNLDVYKYYLSKQRKMDDWGVPVIQYKQKFNSETGEVETVPDYEAMFDVYFQKTDIRNMNFSTSFDTGSNHVDYAEITTRDPMWHEDQYVYEKVWETEYNFVESKYLGLGISYRLTDLMFKNIMLLKLIMNNEDSMGSLMFTLPRITGGDLDVPVFDAIIALICLMASKHNLTGEIITIPTQVISVIDFMTNVDGGNEFLVDTLALDLDVFDLTDPDNTDMINELDGLIRKTCSAAEADRFMNHVKAIANNRILLTTEMKGDAINEIYQNANALYTLLQWLSTKTNDRKTYEAIRTMYKAAYYSREVKDTFTIFGEKTGFPRTAWTFFEYLYYRNPKLYTSLFQMDFEKAYEDYLKEHALTPAQLPYSTFIYDYEHGNIRLDFSTINASSVDDQSAKDEFIYFNANHIISQLSIYFDNLENMTLLGDMASVLEDMLRQLVLFFKSYTVDLISFETTIICDLKMENLIRFFDEIFFIEKTTHMDENMHLSYADALHKIVVKYGRSDLCAFDDYLRSHVTIRIDDLYDWVTNKIPFHDSADITEKTIQIDAEHMPLFDTFHKANTTISVHDKTPGMKMRDEIRIYWSDDL